MFTDFANRVRILRAGRLLLHSDSPIAHIGKEIGIGGVAGFGRRFFESKGTAPSESRRQASRVGGKID